MQEIHFKSLDLNLLRVFAALMEERNGTRAGHRLGLSQSAVSHALRRLRHVLKDELFVRAADGMQPTARAISIAPQIRQGLAQLQRALGSTEFTPALTDRRFTIACNDYICAALLPGVVTRLRVEAPNMALRVRPSRLRIAHELDAGRVDIAIANFGTPPERFHCETLFRERMVWVVSVDNPVACETLTLDRLALLPHLILGLFGDEPMPRRAWCRPGPPAPRAARRCGMRSTAPWAAQGLRRTIAVTVPHPLAAPRIVCGTDMAALLPHRLAASQAERYRLKLFEPPYASPPFEVKALWHRDQSDDPALSWLRSQFREVAATL